MHNVVAISVSHGITMTTPEVRSGQVRINPSGLGIFHQCYIQDISHVYGLNTGLPLAGHCCLMTALLSLRKPHAWQACKAWCFPTASYRGLTMLSAMLIMMQVAEFYKSWDLYGALSNFSAHPISMPSGPVSISGALPSAPFRQWPSVEHFYQAQKFAGQPILCLCFASGGCSRLLSAEALVGLFEW